ncbi:DMT family transporter [Reyranella sp.]|uniref:DMT family transporter n=1 Tax=Reyranella sp. TaxID=1929291 RepID=UPI003BAA60E6
MIDNTRGILAMSASVVVFIFNDALIKLAAESVPAVQAIGVRGLFATLWCALALLATGAWRHIAWAAHPRIVLRGVLEAGAAIVYLVALFHIPFAIATAVNLATPLILTVLAVLILGEDVRWRRWLAVIAGFVGVLLVIQPHPGDLNAWTWVALVGTVIGAFRDVIARFLPVGVPTLVVSFTTALIVAVVGCGWAVVEGWQPMGGRAVGFIAASSLLLAAGYQFLVLALRSGGEVSVMGAFRYASILWALGIGYVVWGEVPDALAMAGIAVIVGSGLYILHRERVRR